MLPFDYLSLLNFKQVKKSEKDYHWRIHDITEYFKEQNFKNWKYGISDKS